MGEIKLENICPKKGRNLRAVFGEEFLVFNLTIWERFNGFRTNIHPYSLLILVIRLLLPLLLILILLLLLIILFPL